MKPSITVGIDMDGQPVLRVADEVNSLFARVSPEMARSLAALLITVAKSAEEADENPRSETSN